MLEYGKNDEAILMACKAIAVNYGIHFNTYFFPLKASELFDGLEKKGFEIPQRIPFPRPPVAPSGSGVIARKGKAVIHLDSRSQAITIADVSIKSVLSIYSEIATMLNEDYQINIESLIGTYEFAAQFEARIDKQAYETFSKNIEIPILTQMGEILQKKLSAIEIKFGEKNMNVNSDNWFDFSIEPNYTRNDSYLIDVSNRTQKKEESISLIESIEEKINKIVELISK
jgi:hypothetical protein